MLPMNMILNITLIGGSQDVDNSSSILVSDIFEKYNNVNIYNSPITEIF